MECDITLVHVKDHYWVLFLSLPILILFIILFDEDPKIGFSVTLTFFGTLLLHPSFAKLQKQGVEKIDQILLSLKSIFALVLIFGGVILFSIKIWEEKELNANEGKK